MAGLTIQFVRGPRTIGDLQWVVADVTFDDSYAASGGESLTAADLHFTTADPYAKIVKLSADPAGGFTILYSYSDAKLGVYVPGIAIGTAGSATIDDYPLSGTGATATSIGLKNDASSPVRFGPMQEVASGVNLSSLTTRVLAFASK